MNYLGHAYLSFGDGGILTGNMIGDHVKGRLALDRFPAAIRKGLELHRKIDAFSDVHPATLRAKVLFKADYGLYSGAIMDTLYDHFLANDPKLFPTADALKEFSQETYVKLEQHKEFFPEAFAGYFPHMRQHDWLSGYRSLKGTERSLLGLSRRALHMPPPEKAYETFVVNFYNLNQCYFELIDDLIPFVKKELAA